jgi:hypothetical protein
MLQSVAAAVRLLLSLGILGAMGAGSWVFYDSWVGRSRELERKRQELVQKDLEIQGLQSEILEKDATIERLDLAMRLLKVERRLAQVIVLEQTGSLEQGDFKTRCRFVEVNEQGEPLGDPQEFTIEGDLLYVDAWVVKFEDLLVEQGDPLRSASLCLFRRLFGEEQKPADGLVLDTPFERPAIYGGEDNLSDLEKEVWQNFWEYANDPERAAELGIRAAHGEAPSMKLKKGQIYELSLRASGGLTFSPQRIPAVVQE